jgi:hypothetical protein
MSDLFPRSTFCTGIRGKNTLHGFFTRNLQRKKSILSDIYGGGKRLKAAPLLRFRILMPRSTSKHFLFQQWTLTVKRAVV